MKFSDRLRLRLFSDRIRQPRSTSFSALFVLAATAWVAGCGSGLISGGKGKAVITKRAEGASGSNANSGGARGFDKSSHIANSGADQSAPKAPDGYARSPGLRRLSPEQHAFRVKQIFGVTLDGSLLPTPSNFAYHRGIAAANTVGQDDLARYLDAAEKAAEASWPTFERESACSGAAAETCFDAAIAALALRALPAEANDARLKGLRERARPRVAGESTAFRYRRFVTALLVSPAFLYVDESGVAAGAPAPGWRALTGPQIAQRLASLLTQGAPDATLMGLARSGALAQPETRRAEAKRLLAGARAEAALTAFVTEWFALHKGEIAKKDAKVLAGLPAGFADAAEAQIAQLVRERVLGGKRSLLEVLRADASLPNAIAPVFADAGGAAARRGILTTPLFLASHTKEGGASPFPLGRFLMEGLLCHPLDGPPSNISLPNPDKLGAGTTLRQALESATKGEPCHSCHRLISPPGFAFLPFDPVGRFRGTDAASRPIETAGTLSLGLASAPESLTFASAADFAAKVAGTRAVRACLTKRLFRWSFGRFEEAADAAFLERLEKSVVDSDANIDAVFSALAGSEEFARVRVAQ